MLNKSDLNTLRTMIYGIFMEYIDEEDLIRYCDSLIVAYEEVPYYVIAISLKEYRCYGDMPVELRTASLGDKELCLYLKHAIKYYSMGGDPDLLIYRMQGLWNEFKYPDVMKEYYPFDESVSPHSGRQVSKQAKIDAIEKYIQSVELKIGGNG